MFDRSLLRDVTLAVLLGLPTLALARPQAETADHPAAAKPIIEQAAFVDQSTIERRLSISTEG